MKRLSINRDLHLIIAFAFGASPIFLESTIETNPIGFIAYGIVGVITIVTWAVWLDRRASCKSK